ncbi:hypothetical protein CB1_028233014 [Camelus ferus]|nr:hypothetical protein CB1_028233014 [Camelus ferus]
MSFGTTGFATGLISQSLSAEDQEGIVAARLGQASCSQVLRALISCCSLISETTVGQKTAWVSTARIFLGVRLSVCVIQTCCYLSVVILAGPRVPKQAATLGSQHMATPSIVDKCTNDRCRQVTMRSQDDTLSPVSTGRIQQQSPTVITCIHRAMEWGGDSVDPDPAQNPGDDWRGPLLGQDLSPARESISEHFALRIEEGEPSGEQSLSPSPPRLKPSATQSSGQLTIVDLVSKSP